MRLPVTLMAATLLAIATFGPAAVLSAATPTPTPSPIPSATPEPTVAASPTPVERGMMILGRTWVDARPSSADVRAFIGGVECASSQQVGTDAGYTFTLTIPAASERPGCGVPGATITFKVGDRDAPQTVTWQSGTTLFETLIAGPPFTLYAGTFTYRGPLAQIEVEPLINGVVCGIQLNPPLGEGPTWDFVVVVDPDVLRPGCGRPGVTVTFRLVRVTGTSRVPIADAAFNGVWGPGESLTAQLTFSAASSTAALPATGAPPPASGSPLLPLVMAALGAGGAALLLGGRLARRTRR